MKSASIRFFDGPQRLVRARPHVIVLGNEKGGSGKSTTAMHLAIALMKRGFAVATIDLDARQGTFSRMLENRQAFAAEAGLRLDMPAHHRIERSQAATREAAEAAERQDFEAAVADLSAHDFIVCDTPGSDSFQSRLAHARADTLVTPLNDSFIDLDLLARIDREGRHILGPSVYAEMVWQQRMLRAQAGRAPTDWVVMRNRLAHLDARNKRDIGRLLDELSRRIGFRLAPGFGERVIFRELFPKGLTLLDLRQEGTGVGFSMSHLAAREEVRQLVDIIGVAEAPTEAELSAAPA